ncbi:unnamed protein product [Prunus brigantina]
MTGFVQKILRKADVAQVYAVAVAVPHIPIMRATSHYSKLSIHYIFILTVYFLRFSKIIHVCCHLSIFIKKIFSDMIYMTLAHTKQPEQEVGAINLGKSKGKSSPCCWLGLLTRTFQICFPLLQDR